MPRAAYPRILHLDDDPNDIELVRVALQADGLGDAITTVMNRPGFERALAEGPYDLVLSDYSLPDFSGMQAVEMVRAQAPEMPFILVTGTIGDEGVGAVLRAGVTDYVLKNRLERLAPAVRRALQEVRERRRRVELEEQLRQAQKMEAVGQLTGGIAHDFNNILTVMIASAELVGLGLRPDQDELRGDVDALLAAGVRGKEMIRKLLGFSRRQPLAPQALDVRPFLTDVVDTLRRLLPASIVVTREVVEPLPALSADPGSLEQMVLNLATNARDAMPDGGTLTLGAALAEADDRALERHGAAPGRFVRISVRDTGMGMTEDVLQRVFEPFFTTKPADKGTGLGMAMIYGLAQQQLGFVDIVSAVGRGTTVALYFPIAPEAAVRKEPNGAPRSWRGAAPPGGTTVLVADDELTLRRATERVLVSLGYRVLVASTGREALEQLLRHQDEIRLVITDQMMPDFGGADVYREARAGGIGTPFLVTSGYSSEELEEKGFGPEVRRLMKPWTIDEMAAAVRTLLSAES